MKHPHDMTDDELREAVAREVFGWLVTADCQGRVTGYGTDASGKFNRLPDYPRDIAAAWTVACQVQSCHGNSFQLDTGHGIIDKNGKVRRVDARFFNAVGPVMFDVHAYADDMELTPRAICEAAVLAVRAKGGK